MHKDAKILPSAIRKNIALLKLMHSVAHDQSLQYPMNVRNKRYMTGSSLVPTIYSMRPRTEWLRHNIAYKGPARWLN